VTAHTTTQINSDGRASRMTTQPHDHAGGHRTTKKVTFFGDLVSKVQMDTEKDRTRSIGNRSNVHCATFALNVRRLIACNLFP